ncbi:MAG: branched-chain amino acid transaminase [Candidatus Eisenbacteria bacterium]|nr:branched-chain amino acid transaminase [Candidatus Eisenbacteria bacterium]
MTGKNRYAFFGGTIAPIDEARISVMTSAFLYGTAVFEGLRAFWSDEREELYVFRMREHFERLLRGCRILRIEIPFDADGLSAATLDLLRTESFREDAYIRPVAYKSDHKIGVRLDGIGSDFTMFAVPLGAYIDKPEGARLMVSSWRRVADDAIPPRGKINGAYVNSALAKSEARENGFDDALMLTADGHVSEASAANLFLARNGALHTPPSADEILEGITRDAFIRLARDRGMEVIERRIDRSEVYAADEAFLCGTAVNIVPVTEVDRRTIGDGRPGPITRRLRSLFERVVVGAEPEYRGWCSPVYRSRGDARTSAAFAPAVPA